MQIKKQLKRNIKRILPKQNNKVSLFIVGAQKAGTSALNRYLIKYSEIISGYIKEINFFNHQENFLRGKNWYHKQYERPLFYKAKKTYLDATPQYLFDLDVAKKIYDYNRNAKIVILLREPISRAFSAWNMYKQFSELETREKEILLKEHISDNEKQKFSTLINYQPFPSFSEFVEKELINNRLVDFYPNIIKRGVYVEQIKPYINLFGVNNVLIYESEYFKNNKLSVTNSILKKLNLTPLKIETSHLRPVHTRTYEATLNKETQQKLVRFYKPHNEELFKLINQKFNW